METIGLAQVMSDRCSTEDRPVLRSNYYANLPMVKATQGVKRLEGKYAGDRVIVVGAGPSLDQALPRLKAWRGAIIAVDRAARALLAYGITPNYVVTVDLSPMAARKFDGALPLLRNIPLIFDPLCCPESVERYPGPLYTFNKGQMVKDKGAIRQGTGVVTYAVGLAELMGAARIILVGVDLSYPDGKRHAAAAARIDGEVWDKDLDVMGVNGSLVKSDAYMAANVEELGAVPAGVLVQTSPSGAFIPGAEHAPLEVIP